MLAVRASSGGLLIPIPTTASDSAGFDHHLPVPTGTNLIFAIQHPTSVMPRADLKNAS